MQPRRSLSRLNDPFHSPNGHFHAFVTSCGSQRVVVNPTCRQASWGHRAPETAFKYVHASDDGGRTWQHVGLPGPIQWPQIFTVASGAVVKV